MATGYFEYRIELPPSVVKAHPESFYYLFQAGSKAKRERVDWPERVNRQDYPQTDQARTWSSTLAISVNGRPVDRITLPDDSADARGVLSHLAGVEPGSHGELVDGLVVLTDRDRAVLATPAPWSCGWPCRRTLPSAGASAFSVRPPARCRWIPPSKSTPEIHCPPTWASIPTDQWPCQPDLEFAEFRAPFN